MNANTRYWKNDMTTCRTSSSHGLPFSKESFRAEVTDATGKWPEREIILAGE